VQSHWGLSNRVVFDKIILIIMAYFIVFKPVGVTDASGLSLKSAAVIATTGRSI